MDDSKDDSWFWIFLGLVAIGMIAAWLPHRGILGLLGLLLAPVLLLQILLGSFWILAVLGVVALVVLEDDRLARFDFGEKVGLVILGPITLFLLSVREDPEWLAKLGLTILEAEQNQGTLTVSESDRVIDQISQNYLRRVKDLLRR